MRTLLLILLTFMVASAAGAEMHHIDVLAESEVPLSGWPHYVENLTVGSPISDHGSHSGIKASVTSDYSEDHARHIPTQALLNSAQYAAWTELSGQLDQFFVTLNDEATDRFFPYEREIEFSPWGFVESGSDGELLAEGRVFTLDTDRFAYLLTIENQSGHPVTLTPSLVFQEDGERIDESLNILRFSGKYKFSAIDTNNLSLSYGRRTFVYRKITTSFPIDATSTAFGKERAIIQGEPIVLAPGESAQLAWTIRFSLDPDDLPEAPITPQQIETAWRDAQDEWTSFFNTIPPVHTDDAEMNTLAQVAATGLRMNVYAPRNAMTARASAPAKAHFSSFWGWDTAFQAMGHAHFDTELAKENLNTLFSGPDSRIYLELGDDLLPPWGPDFSQPPVAGRAIWDVFVKDGAWDVAWLTRMYVHSREYLRWWREEKDIDSDGLSEFTNGLEVGWDDSPRYHCNLPVSLCIERVDYVDSLSLNAWLADYAVAMEKMAEVVLPGDAAAWRDRSQEIGERIETLLWDETFGAYFDLDSDGTDHRLHHVLTPALAWPLFAGIARDLERVRRVIEDHLLNAEEFWPAPGRMIPTVAFSDHAYDGAQDGYYWEGQSWLVASYAIIEALHKYGYEDEAKELAAQTLESIVANDPGGIYEAYDAMTGKTGFSANGRLLGLPGEPAAFQFGWSCTFVLELLRERYQRLRILLPEDTSFTGHIERAEAIGSGTAFYAIETPGPNVPFVDAACTDDVPLTGECIEFTLQFSDPWGELSDEDLRVTLPMAEDAEVIYEPDDGGSRVVDVETLERGIAFAVNPQEYGTYRVTLPDLDRADSDNDGDEDDACCGGWH
jgi:Mannosylglycerate hydrolase MGH1-like glycoside hydrolase domain